MNSRSISFTAVAVLVLLVDSAVAQHSAGRFTFASLKQLATLANTFRADVAQSAAAGSIVKVQVRTKGVADPKASGCGFAFLVNDDASLSSHVPPFEQATCSAGGGGPRVNGRVQFVRPDETYYGAVTLTNRPDNVTFTSNGGDGLAIDTLCLGFKTGDGDAQAFCLDSHLLDMCYGRSFYEKKMLGPVHDGIRLSRTLAGLAAPRMKEISFHFLEDIARGFESLTLNPLDDAVVQELCWWINLKKEKSPWAYDPSKCYAQRKVATDDAAGEFYYVKMDARHLNENCTRATN